MNTTNTTTKTGSLNFARLIEEAEALLIGEATAGCSNCGNCSGGKSTHTDRCADRTNAKLTAHRPLATAQA